MSRWKALPASLDERARQLVTQLRRMKDRSGLSLPSLQAKTGYSRSSWERYLNGKALPPRQAVEELARVCGIDDTRVLALYDVAAQEWQQKADTAEEHATSEPRGTHRRATLIGLCTAVVLGALLVGLLVTAPWENDERTEAGAKGTPPRSSSSGTFVYKPGKTYPCSVKEEDGGLYAGYSTARIKVLDRGTQGWDVVEAQCLLRHHGFDPDGVDGVYGAKTAQAVKLLQKEAGTYVDGVVGRHTWQALRK
ncbi:helix-turn-helix domain-containing protein [Streptomyces sp. DW26H14]|uniref:helix-turn-helix domain-containing protein n=1 Tax=Streptomyces sp. DW26H14 TaxID=3435395 RepID=UPI00403DE08C